MSRQFRRGQVQSGRIGGASVQTKPLLALPEVLPQHVSNRTAFSVRVAFVSSSFKSSPVRHSAGKNGRRQFFQSRYASYGRLENLWWLASDLRSEQPTSALPFTCLSRWYHHLCSKSASNFNEGREHETDHTSTQTLPYIPSVRINARHLLLHLPFLSRARPPALFRHPEWLVL